MMATTDEHPEVLVDRALAGELGKAERGVLDVHLSSCSACALHLAMGTRLRDGTPATARDQDLNRLAIAGALARAQSRDGGRRWAGRTGWMWLRAAAAGVVLAGGLAAAAVSLRTSRAPRTAAVPTRAAAPVARHLAPAAAVEPEAAVAPPPGPVIAASSRPEPSQERPSQERPAKLGPSAALLFARASDLRHQGRVDQAIDTYRALQRRFPRTREANLSLALAGRLQLDRDRPAQALTDFDRYLRVDAEVAEEALAGRAEALHRLGRRREETAAWRSLVTRFPGSIYSERARSRLAAPELR
jgi:tetratricopeptide (TPR) repeat protein